MRVFPMLVLWCCLPAGLLGAQGALERRVDAYFATAVAAHDFSGSVLIARGDSVLLRKAYGLASVEFGVAATPETRYIIASLTKTLTAAAVVRLRDQGRLRLSDTVARYLPAFPHGPLITLTHLLGHESGVANPDYRAWFGRDVSLDELIAEIGKQPLAFQPGRDSRYSNAGYNLLAAVIEHVTGQTYDAALRDLVLGPARMAATGDASNGAALADLATPYVAGPGAARVRVASGNGSAGIGAGSVYSTVDDLFRWCRAIQTNRVFQLESIPYAYGWGQRRLAGGRWLEQTGLLDGWASNLYVGRDSAIIVVILANHSTPSFGRWGRDLAQVVMGRTDSVAPLRPELPEREARVNPAPYVGRYASRNLTLRVTVAGGALYAEVDHWPVARYLAALGSDRFVVGDFGMEIEFTRDAQGAVSGVAWAQDSLRRQ